MIRFDEIGVVWREVPKFTRNPRKSFVETGQQSRVRDLVCIPISEFLARVSFAKSMPCGDILW